MKIKRVLIILITLALMLLLCGCKSLDYKKAVELYNAGDYDAAQTVFESLEDYKDSKKYLGDIRQIRITRTYNEAVALYEQKEYYNAYELFKTVHAYENSSKYIAELEPILFNEAEQAFNIGDWKTAENYFKTLKQSGYADNQIEEYLLFMRNPEEYIGKSLYSKAENSDTGSLVSVAKSLGMNAYLAKYEHVHDQTVEVRYDRESNRFGAIIEMRYTINGGSNWHSDYYTYTGSFQNAKVVTDPDTFERYKDTITSKQREAFWEKWK